MAYCIFSVRFSILVNGSPTGFFSSSCGLRQRDPLSRLLFVIVMEVLGKMLSTALSRGLLSGFSMGTWADISYLLFADDTLLFYGADPNHLRNLWSLYLTLKLYRV
jgi:hypothetical protein